MDRPEVEVRRSHRRTRTVSAYRKDGKVIVMIPARFSRAEEAEWVTTMLGKLERTEQRGRRTDEHLMRRARELSREYLQGRAQPSSVRWVDNMTQRWGSCTTGEGTIRLSNRLRSMPTWVIDYVLLHELTHLLEPNHNARFWAWVDQFPRSERAKGYLEGITAAAHLDFETCDQAGEPAGDPVGEPAKDPAGS